MKKDRKQFYFGMLKIVVCSLLCSSCVSTSDTEKVKIITPNETGKRDVSIPAPQADFVCKIKDVLIFYLRSDIIDRRGALGFSDFQISGLEQGGVYSSSLFGSRLSAVNVLFVNISGDSYKLFESDRFISRMEIYSPLQNKDSIYPYSLEKNLYSVADKDSNSDGFLSEDDQQNLYSSDYNGTNLKLILEDISGYRIIDDNEVLIFCDTGDTEVFYLYKAESEELVKLNTKA